MLSFVVERLLRTFNEDFLFFGTLLLLPGQPSLPYCAAHQVNESIEYIRSSLGLHKESYNEALDRAR